MGFAFLNPEWGGLEKYAALYPWMMDRWWGAFAFADVAIQWNSAFLDTCSCDGDLYLDRHRGFGSYRGSGATVSIRVSGLTDQGVPWTQSYTVQAVPEDAFLDAGIWHNSLGGPIGPQVWYDEVHLNGDFAIILQSSSGAEIGVQLVPAPQYFSEPDYVY